MPRPSKRDLPAPYVRDFRAALDAALAVKDDQERVISTSRWGVYAFYDYDGEPIYVGQTNEQLRVRVKRHLTNQRTDAVAMRVLDVFEVAEIELYPLWGLAEVSAKDPQAKELLDAVEYNAYLQAIDHSRFKAILNEKIPPVSPRIDLPPAYRFQLISDDIRAERGHPDVRIGRRAETIARLAAVAHERGEVSDGLRRVLVIQAVRLAYIAADRLAQVEGRPQPDPSLINAVGLVGSVLEEPADAPTEADLEEHQLGEG